MSKKIAMLKFSKWSDTQPAGQSTSLCSLHRVTFLRASQKNKKNLPFLTLVVSNGLVEADTIIFTAVLPLLALFVLMAVVHTGVCSSL